jgi:hypothetical protein
MKVVFTFLSFIFFPLMLSGQDKTLNNSAGYATVSESSLNAFNHLSADTAGINRPSPVNKAGMIKFPNAFRWNHTGPTGGYWQENRWDDNVFRPVFANILNYNLQVFNRWGLLVYESKDVYKGWDGYLENGELANQGVYIWKASGKFTDGTDFNRVGDVTFLY